MDLAKPPDDPEQKNIIDKLANFVARNGPEFEQLTKAKQKDNPRFSFLFGGENFNYYQYRVTTEQAILKKQHQQQQQQQSQQQHGMVPQSMPAAPWQSGPPPNTLPPPGLPPPGIPPPNLVTTAALPAISAAPPSVGSTSGVIPGLAPPAVDTNQLQQQLQQKVQEQQQLEKTLEQKQTEFAAMKEQVMAQQTQASEQITQSNQNLAAQYQSLMQQQEMLCDQAVREMKENQLEKLAEDCDVTLSDMDNIVKPIIESCTKDAISTGKNWIFTHNFTENHTKLITQYLLSRVTAKDATFELRLHLIYLINDVLHHCKRKNMDDLLLKFGKVVVPIFCTTHVTADDAKKAKLTKLLNLWRQNDYFPEAVSAMEDPGTALTNCQKEEMEEFSDVVKGITKDIQQRYSGLNKQHQEFVSHVQNQITANQTALTNGETAVKAMEAQLTGIKAAITALSSQMVPPKIEPPPVTSEPPLTNVQGAPAGVPPFPPPRGFSGPPPNFSAPPPGFPGGPPPPGMPPGLPPVLPNAPPPTMGGPPIQLPDLSKPPPGFMSMPPGPPAPPQICEADLMPSVPYYELPAGLLAPLVKLDDSDYRPLIPSDIRLPPPMPPSERLLAAVEAFYSAPSHERPRDAEGWEKLGLYEFFKAKQKAKKMRESEDRNRREQREVMERNDGNNRNNAPKKRRYQEEQKRKRSRSKSPQAMPKSGGSSPLPYQRSSRSRSKSRSKSRSRSRSRSKSRTPSPPRRRRSRSRSRSATPPSFFNEPFYQTNADSRIGEENKGHQLMKKMGWGGGGLGSTEQGRVEPVEAAEVRDKTDMYKGIGTGMADPFEQFRKSKSQGYVNRMRVRAEPGK